MRWITCTTGSRVVRLAADGHVVFDIHVPVHYPSDAQLNSDGNVVVADYNNPGAVVIVSPAGKLLWRYGPTSGAGRLDHPSLAVTTTYLRRLEGVEDRAWREWLKRSGSE